MNLRIFAIAAALTATVTITHAAEMELWRLDCGSIRVKDLSTFSDTFDYAGMSRTLTDSCYLIRHDHAYMLWDTGLPASLLGAPQDAGAAMASTLARTVVDQLGEIGVKRRKYWIVELRHVLRIGLTGDLEVVFAEVEIYGGRPGGGRDCEVLHQSDSSLHRGLECEKHMFLVDVGEIELDRL